MEDAPLKTLSWSSLHVKKYEIKEIRRNNAIRIKNAPVIFQVRSSRANFFRSIFSSFSGFRSVAVFFGLSAGLFLDAFFSLLAMRTKIIKSCKRQAASFERPSVEKHSLLSLGVSSAVLTALSDVTHHQNFPQSGIVSAIKSKRHI